MALLSTDRNEHHSGGQAGRAFTRTAGLTAALLALPGCTVEAGAPSIALFGAYFPAWMACAAGGIIGAILLRLVFIRTGIDDALPARLPIYAGIAAAIGFLISITSFGR